VNSFFTGVRGTIAPPAGARHGPLPPLLLGLTVVTGLVDAFSYLVLGHVFVANMTGNVVFLGFALAGARGFSIGASTVALVSFGLGALAGGKAGARFGQDRSSLLSVAVSGQVALLAIAVIVAALSPQPVPGGFRYPLVIALALAMGSQNAMVRQLGVPELQSTNVLTTAITGIAADSLTAASDRASAGRRSLSVAALFLGALVGAVFVVHVVMLLPLIVALVALTAVAVTTRLLGRTAPAWVRP
jgi:uncharacterized membrane protein YoaK (UPF0700 family)